MDAKSIGSLLGAAALAVVPTAGGFMAWGASKERGNTTMASGLLAGATLTGLGIAVGLANYYILGLDDVTDQISNVLGNQSSVGMLNVQRRLGRLAGGLHLPSEPGYQPVPGLRRPSPSGYGPSLPSEEEGQPPPGYGLHPPDPNRRVRPPSRRHVPYFSGCPTCYS